MEDFNKYKVFYEVAKEGNITKAAENLYISQPAISQTIKKLEEELEVNLFIRSKKGVSLTSIGQEIFSKVESAILSLKEIDKIIEEKNELLSGEVVIGAGSNIARELLTIPISQFLKDFPSVKIKLFEQTQEKMLKFLKDGKADLVISQQAEPIEDLIFCPLKNYSYVFVKSKNGNANKFISMSKGSYAYKLLSDTLKILGKDKQVDVVGSGYLTAIELAKLGVGVVLVPKFIAQKYIDSGELMEVYTNIQLPSVTFGYYYNKESLMPATKVFIKFLENI